MLFGPAAKARGTSDRERPTGKDYPRNILPAHKITIMSVCARLPPKVKIQKKVALSCEMTVAGLSREATTALSHKVTDASPEGVGVVWPGSG